MSTLNTTARTVEQIEADLAPIQDAQKALTAQVEPLLLELLRAKVHAHIPDAVSVGLYASEWDNGWFYDANVDVTSADGTVTAWSDLIEGYDDGEVGGLEDTFLADLSNLYGACEGSPDLTIDLVHLKPAA